MGNQRGLIHDVAAGSVIAVVFCVFAGVVLVTRTDLSASLGEFARVCLAYVAGGVLGGVLFHFTEVLSSMRGGGALRGFLVSLPATFAFSSMMPDESVTWGARVFAALFASAILGAGIGQLLLPRRRA